MTCAPGISCVPSSTGTAESVTPAIDVGAFVDRLRLVADHDLDVAGLRHFAAELLAVLSRGTVHLQPFDIAHARERPHVGARHAAGAEHADHLGVALARYLTPMPPSAPTRMCCRYPSLMKASGSPVSIEVSRINPQ